ncbi:hypothetical protein AJ78_00680 [Emergomyces pasteurianus Ep9510]|uniref:Major facilitator superfamily (MFS) profile domain-containing protein n=1 Tax=Emergomyces pasteurianus Ep9510 TaxID=1447872 RepID=A0A1J9PSC2_9EURO|nr:hypothetical protein AJ78_00680 [Emergomyces pasteurianus Ep9510]
MDTKESPISQDNEPQTAGKDFKQRETGAVRDTLVELISEKATHHVDQVGFKFLLEPYTAGSLAAMSFGLFCAAWGFAPPAAVLVFINADIGSPNSASGLFSVIQTIGTTLGYMFVGRLSEVYGRRWVMIVFTSLGLLGAIICATVKDFNTFIGAGVLVGLATGAQCCYAFLAGELMPNKHKLFGAALVVTFCLPGTGLGALLARSLVEHASWRWIYYIYIMASVVSLALYVIFYHPQEAARELNKWEQTKNLDFVGIFFLIVGLVLFILGIMTGGNPYPWTSARVLGMLISGGVCLIVLVIYESYMGTRAFLAVHLFKDVRGFSMNCICSAVGGIAYVGVSILWPTQVNFIYGGSESWQTLAAMSCTIGLGLWTGMVFLGPLWGPFGYPRVILIGTNLWFTAFIGALAQCNPNNKGFGIAMSFLAAVPIGFVEQQTGAITQLFAADKDIGTSFGTMGCMRTGVGAIGTAVLLAILSSKSKTELAAHVIPAALGAGLPQSSLEALFSAMLAGTPTAMQSVPGISPQIMAAVATAQTAGYTAAYKYVYYAAVAFGLVACISAMFLRPIGHLLTNHVPKMVEKQDLVVDESASGEV